MNVRNHGNDSIGSHEPYWGVSRGNTKLNLSMTCQSDHSPITEMTLRIKWPEPQLAVLPVSKLASLSNTHTPFSPSRCPGLYLVVVNGLCTSSASVVSIPTAQGRFRCHSPRFSQRPPPYHPTASFPLPRRQNLNFATSDLSRFYTVYCNKSSTVHQFTSNSALILKDSPSPTGNLQAILPSQNISLRLSGWALICSDLCALLS